jgi:hypothetical protein
MNPSFRAWDKLNNEMYVVEQINFDCGEFESIGYGITFLRGADKIELMQSTGLKDKNGQEIFEGDILKSNKYITSVFYERGAYCVKFSRTPNTTVTMNVISFIEKYKTKIIGNIYEDPELLEVEE